MTRRHYDNRVLAYVKTGNAEACWYWNQLWRKAMGRLLARGRVRYSARRRVYVAVSR
jgi:hypothetical protein